MRFGEREARSSVMGRRFGVGEWRAFAWLCGEQCCLDGRDTGSGLSAAKKMTEVCPPLAHAGQVGWRETCECVRRCAMYAMDGPNPPSSRCTLGNCRTALHVAIH